jgi:hypothetical protein
MGFSVDQPIAELHRDDSHELLIAVPELRAGASAMAFPVIIRCSCGELEMNAFATINLSA